MQLLLLIVVNDDAIVLFISIYTIYGDGKESSCIRRSTLILKVIGLSECQGYY